MSNPELFFEVVAVLWLFSSLRKYVMLLVASNVALFVRPEGNNMPGSQTNANKKGGTLLKGYRPRYFKLKTVITRSKH